MDDIIADFEKVKKEYAQAKKTLLLRFQMLFLLIFNLFLIEIQI